MKNKFDHHNDAIPLELQYILYIIKQLLKTNTNTTESAENAESTQMKHNNQNTLVSHNSHNSYNLHDTQDTDCKYSKNDVIDWPLFLQLIIHHRLHPFITCKMTQMNDLNIPLQVKQTLKQHYKQNTFNMLLLTSEMKQISHIFNEHDIKVLFLKGPIVAQQLYGDYSLRTSSDLDFLVPIDQLEASEELLLNLGYIKEDYIRTILNDWKWRHHHTTYYHAEKGIKVELHWRLHPGPGIEPSFAQLWLRRNEWSINQTKLFGLGREDLLCFLISHGARHGWSRLRWLLDIHFVLTNELNWTVLHQLLRRYQLTHVAGQAIILCQELFNTPISTEMHHYIGKRANRLALDAYFYFNKMVELHSESLDEDIALYHKRHLFALRSFRQKVIFLLSYLFPYPEDAELLPLPKMLHILYFPLRPILWAWRKTRNVVS